MPFEAQLILDWGEGLGIIERHSSARLQLSKNGGGLQSTPRRRCSRQQGHGENCLLAGRVVELMASRGFQDSSLPCTLQ